MEIAHVEIPTSYCLLLEREFPSISKMSRLLVAICGPVHKGFVRLLRLSAIVESLADRRTCHACSIRHPLYWRSGNSGSSRQVPLIPDHIVTPAPEWRWHL